MDDDHIWLIIHDFIDYQCQTITCIGNTTTVNDFKPTSWSESFKPRFEGSGICNSSIVRMPKSCRTSQAKNPECSCGFFDREFLYVETCCS